MGFEQITIEEVPSEYKGLVRAVRYRGKALQPEEKVPSGAPLTMVVGSGIQSDSLNMDREYIVSPERDRPVRQEQRSEPSSQEGARVDESFF